MLHVKRYLHETGKTEAQVGETERERERSGTEGKKEFAERKNILLEETETTMETPSEENREQRQGEGCTNESRQRAPSASDYCVYWRYNLLLPALFVSTQESATSCPAGTFHTTLTCLPAGSH